MASTVRIPPGGNGGGGLPGDEPSSGGKKPETGTEGDRPSTAPTTERTPLASNAQAAQGLSNGGTLRLTPVPLGEAPPPELPMPADATPDAVTIPIPVTGVRPQCPICGERFSRGSRFCAFDGTRLVETAEDLVADPLVGQLLGGKYTVLKSIGEGGMGTVYEVRHNALDRRFAMKILRPEIAQSGEHLQRFLQEAKAAAAIGHPNIVSVSDFGEHEIEGRSVPFIVMELLRGTSLAALLREEKVLKPSRAAEIIAGCADALAAAHAVGVIHRDLKPDNIFLAKEGRETVKVLDFGVAKMQGASKRLTKVGMVFGTPHYMSPEQARGQTIDHRADIYALGVILYECLAGHVPFEADTSMGVLTKQIFANPEPIERVAPDPRRLGALGSIVMRCLAKEPDERFATMDELAAALRVAVQDPKGAAAESLGAHERPKKTPPLRLREDAVIPRPAPAPEQPETKDWRRTFTYAAAVVSVLLFAGVSARAIWLRYEPDTASGAVPVASSAAEPAQTAASATASATATTTATTNAAVASTGDAPTASASATPQAPSGPATAAPIASASSTSSAGRSASPSATGAKAASTADILDPWSRPTKKQGGTNPGVLDPWAPKK